MKWRLGRQKKTASRWNDGLTRPDSDQSTGDGNIRKESVVIGTRSDLPPTNPKEVPMQVENIGRRVDHRYVFFELQSRKCDPPRDKSRGWAVKKFDPDAECISRTPGLDKTRITDDITRHYTTEMSRACDTIMPPRRHHKIQRPALWWVTEISELRNCCIKERSNNGASGVTVS